MAIRKSVIRYEVIYDDEIDSLDCVSLNEIHHMTMEGNASGRFLDSEDEVVLSNEEAYEALGKQGSDPEFMQLFKCGSCGGVFRESDGFDVDENLCNECGY